MKNIYISLILASVLTSGILSFLLMDYFAVDRMELYFQNHFFERDLAAAINGGEGDRRSYYLIADRFPLDGEYSESFSEGLAQLISIRGKALIALEVKKWGGKNMQSFYADIDKIVK